MRRLLSCEDVLGHAIISFHARRVRTSRTAVESDQASAFLSVIAYESDVADACFF